MSHRAIWYMIEPLIYYTLRFWSVHLESGDHPCYIGPLERRHMDVHQWYVVAYSYMDVYLVHRYAWFALRDWNLCWYRYRYWVIMESGALGMYIHSRLMQKNSYKMIVNAYYIYIRVLYDIWLFYPRSLSLSYQTDLVYLNIFNYLFVEWLYYLLTVHLTIHDLIFSSIFYLFLLLIIDHESKHSLSTHRYYFFEVRVDTYWVYGVGFTRTILLHHVWRLRHRYQWGPGVCPVALSTDSR